MGRAGAAIVGTGAGWVCATPVTFTWYAAIGEVRAWPRDFLTPAHLLLVPVAAVLARVVLEVVARIGWTAAPAPWGQAMAATLGAGVAACILGAAWGGGYGLAWMANWALLSGYAFFVFAFTAISCRARAATR